MMNRNFVWKLARCVCTLVLVLGFTLSVVGCAEQTSDTQVTKACPPDCKKACCSKKASCKKAGDKKCSKPCPHKKAKAAAEK